MTYPQHDPYELPATQQFNAPVSGPYAPQQPYPASPIPYGYAQPPMLVQQAKPSSAYAVWALIVGLVGFFAGWCMLGIPCIAAVILGHAALSDTKNDVKSGRGMAVAGLALGYLSLVPALILFFWIGIGIFGAAVPGSGVTPTSTP